jgi:hypothetical protein
VTLPAVEEVLLEFLMVVEVAPQVEVVMSLVVVQG